MKFNDIFKAIGKGVKKAGDKLDNAVDLQKLKFNISKMEDEIDDICEAIGRTVLEASIEGMDYSEALETAKEKFIEKSAELETMNEERRRREGLVLCLNCGNEVDGSSDFCPKCGAKVEKPVDECDTEEASEEKVEEAPVTETEEA